jgi:hypothetical protein
MAPIKVNQVQSFITRKKKYIALYTFASVHGFLSALTESKREFFLCIFFEFLKINVDYKIVQTRPPPSLQTAVEG